MFSINHKIYNTKQEYIRLTAIELYISGFPILVTTLKREVTKEVQENLDSLTNLLDECYTISDRLSLFPSTVHPEELDNFLITIKTLGDLLNLVDLNDLYG